MIAFVAIEMLVGLVDICKSQYEERQESSNREQRLDVKRRDIFFASTALVKNKILSRFSVHI